MIEYGAEVAAGIRTPPAVFRGLIAKANMTTKGVCGSRRFPRIACGNQDRRRTGGTAQPWLTPRRGLQPLGRVLRVHAVTEGSGGVKPTRRRFGHVAVDTREGMVDEGYPLSLTVTRPAPPGRRSRKRI